MSKPIQIQDHEFKTYIRKYTKRANIFHFSALMTIVLPCIAIPVSYFTDYNFLVPLCAAITIFSTSVALINVLMTKTPRSIDEYYSNVRKLRSMVEEHPISIPITKLLDFIPELVDSDINSKNQALLLMNYISNLSVLLQSKENITILCNENINNLTYIVSKLKNKEAVIPSDLVMFNDEQKLNVLTLEPIKPLTSTNIT